MKYSYDRQCNLNPTSCPTIHSRTEEIEKKLNGTFILKILPFTTRLEYELSQEAYERIFFISCEWETSIQMNRRTLVSTQGIDELIDQMLTMKSH